MNRFIMTVFISILIAALGELGLHVGNEHIGLHRSSLAIKEVFAAEKGYKTGMIHPKTGKKIKYWTAPMDPTYIRNEPGKSPMGMDLVPVYGEEGEEKVPSSVIRIDPVTIQNMGVRLARVKRKALVRNIRAYGTVAYDERHMKVVSAWVGGRIDKLYVDFTGVEVRKGDPLAELYSPALVSTQQELILALETRGRLWALGNQEALKSASHLVEATKMRLLLWGITKNQIDEIERNRKVKAHMTIHAPIGGTVIDKKAFEGQYVKEGERLYTIADLSSVWVLADVYEYELPWVRNGMPAEMELSYIPGMRFKGKVLYVYPYMDEKTRTAKLRLEFENLRYRLKPGMYANIYLNPRMSGDSLVIPQEAVIDSGVRKLVFISLGKGKFQPREVKLGMEGNDDEFEVLEGLDENEQIVISGQFLLDSESRLSEAIQKMLEVRQQNSPTTDTQPIQMEDNDLDMSDMQMEEDDLDMSGLNMDDVPATSKKQNP
jgi:Cu(I)/Ag(I) efflux system membrane fusion protein/cobalt-zinc-cadmium efflux system membrane fusion protein